MSVWVLLLPGAQGRCLGEGGGYGHLVALLSEQAVGAGSSRVMGRGVGAVLMEVTREGQCWGPEPGVCLAAVFSAFTVSLLACSSPPLPSLGAALPRAHSCLLTERLKTAPHQPQGGCAVSNPRKSEVCVRSTG